MICLSIKNKISDQGESVY